MFSRRSFLGRAGVAAAAVGVSAVSKVAMAALPEPVIQTKPSTMPPLVPNSGRPYNPVVTLNGWTLPWRMNNGEMPACTKVSAHAQLRVVAAIAAPRSAGVPGA